MLEDRYGNSLTTASHAARDAYVDGVDRFLAAEPGPDAAFERAIEADDGFALAHLALARVLQASGRASDAKAPLAHARDLAAGATTCEQAHINALGLLIDGKGAEACKAARAHVSDHPRDALVAQTCTSVFGLIGFSGQPGRESEQLAYTTTLAPHYGGDWWFLGQHAFAQMEAGQLGPAETSITHAWSQNEASAHNAHIRAHLHYENGETCAGYTFLEAFWSNYDRSAQLHCHVSWHIALWALARGDTETMWRVIDNDLTPGRSESPPLNIMTDLAAILFRAELQGHDVPKERWRTVSNYAAKYFPKPGIAFADVHAALAHAMAGKSDALGRIITDATGPAADVVQTLSEGFAKIASDDWAGAVPHLSKAMASHERIGGSRAQRDLVEYALTAALLRSGQTAEARRCLQLRRPITDTRHAIAGLNPHGPH